MRRFVPLVLLAAAAVTVALLSRGSEHRHHLRAIVDSASYINEGSPVTVAGQRAGRVDSVDVTPDGRARLDLAIDDQAWPLPTGTKLRLRWLSTIALAGRYVELDVPQRATTTIAENATIDAGRPVEVDAVLRTFDSPTRRDLRATLERSGSAVGTSGKALAGALDRGPGVVEQARAVMEDLGDDPRSLRTLVASTDRVLAGVQAADPGLARLLDAADRTFTATSSQATALRSVLAQLPPTLTDARATLSHTRSTLDVAQQVVNRLGRGPQALGRLAAPLSQILAAIIDEGPSAERSLARLRRAAPGLDAFLAEARSQMPRLTSIGREAAKQLACIRPYAPDVAGLATTWSGFQLQGDDRDKYARLYTPVLPWDVTPLNPGQAKKLFPGMRYAFPRPPGEVAGQPWFLPECGVGPETLDPSKDPEAGAGR